MNAPNKPRAFPKLARVVHRRSANGRWVVVEGPFPDGFPRSETRDDPDKALKLLTDGVFARPGTAKATYAKVSANDIVEVGGGSNEFGPVSP